LEICDTMYDVTNQFFPQFQTFKMAEESVVREDVPSNGMLMAIENVASWAGVLGYFFSRILFQWLKSYRRNSRYQKKYSRLWSRNPANKVWSWWWLVRPLSIGRPQYFLRVLIFSNFSFLLTYLITRTNASENWHSSRTIWSKLLMKLLKIAPIRFAFSANLSTPAIHRKCAGDPLVSFAASGRSHATLLVPTSAWGKGALPDSGPSGRKGD